MVCLRTHTCQYPDAVYGSSTFNVNIGGGGIFDDVTANGNWFLGLIDEVAIYDKALTAAQIKAHFDAATISADQPQVAISSPAAGARFSSGGSVTITATATAAAGKTISKMEFFAGTNKVAQATNSPFTVSVSNLADGAYSITARATDSQGLFKDSPAVSIVVGSAPERTCTKGLSQSQPRVFCRGITSWPLKSIKRALAVRQRGQR